MELGQIWPGHQHWLRYLLALHLRLRPFPNRHSRDGTDHELELPHRWRHGNHRRHLLSPLWKEDLHRPRGSGPAKRITGAIFLRV